MQPCSTYSIVIIGGGFSGTMLLVNLLKQAPSFPLHIHLIEKKEQAGPGLAYSPDHTHQLLNIPAERMSAFPDAPAHFCEWLQGRKIAIGPGEFAPRVLYGQYIRDVLKGAVAGKAESISLSFHKDEAIDLTLINKQAEVSLLGGGSVVADRVVLAGGNYAPSHPSAREMAYVQSPRYRIAFWDPDLFKDLHTDDTVLIIGTGLTMIDTVMSLYQRQHRGPIITFSRHGYIPVSHQTGTAYPSFNTELETASSLHQVVRSVNKHIKTARSQGINWRAVIDQLRPHTQSIWLRLPVKEKQRFMRHLRHLWGVARHRMPASCAAVIRELSANKQLQLRAGRIHHIVDTDLVRVHYTPKDGTAQILEAHLLINCTGPESDYGKVSCPLIRNAMNKGYLHADELSLGLRADASGLLSNMHPQKLLYTLGSSLKGVLWESTAVPELRIQARNLALEILKVKS